MKKIFTTLAIISLLTSCNSDEKKEKNALPNKTFVEQITDKAGELASEEVYKLNEKGEKGDKTFIIEGTKLYGIGPNGEKNLFLEKRGNIVYEVSEGQTNKAPLFIFEGDKYWGIDQKTGGKSKLIFSREGKYIYQNGEKGMVKTFVVE